MGKIRIGVLCPSEIAFRRFMPALQKQPDFEYVGIASANEHEWFGSNDSSHDCSILIKEQEKANSFAQQYGGCVFESYQQLLSSSNIDAVYLPLPPALHFKWGKAVLEQGKHLFMEKPFTTRLQDTKELVTIAERNSLAVHENYMFQYHSQLDFIRQTVSRGDIGELRLIRIAFGFPFRGANDFRYNKALGGGALLDCGGYTVKLASMLLGDGAQVIAPQLNFKDGFDVDIYGSATLIDNKGLTAQVSFGMDNSYKCELELWGSVGTVYTNRILTAPDGFEPVVTMQVGDTIKEHNLQPDDCVSKSILFFADTINNVEMQKNSYRDILQQASLIEKFREVANESY